MGASQVDIDTEAGWVTFALPDPVVLDFHQVADALDSAGYELHSITIAVAGVVQSGVDGAWLLIPSTEQRIPLEEPFATGKARIRATVTQLDSSDPRLRVIDAIPPGHFSWPRE